MLRAGGGRLLRAEPWAGAGAGRWRLQVREAAVTSSVSSRMPLRDERNVLSTVKPWSPAAAPSSGGRSRRFQALSISTGPTGHSPHCHQPGRKTGKWKTVRMGKQRGAGRHCEKPESEAGRPAVGPWRRRLPRRACSQLPRVLGWAGACTAPQAAHGRAGAGKGGVVNPPLTWSPLEPNPACPQRGEGRGGGAVAVARRSAEKPG